MLLLLKNRFLLLFTGVCALITGCLGIDADPHRYSDAVPKALFSEELWLLEQTVVISDPFGSLEVGLSSGVVDVDWQITEDWLIACDEMLGYNYDSFCEPVGWFPIQAHVMADGSPDLEMDWQERDALLLDWNLLVENTFFFPDSRSPDTTVSGAQLNDGHSVRLHRFDPENILVDGLDEDAFEYGELYLVEFEQTIYLMGDQVDGSDYHVGIRTQMIRQ